MKYPNDDELRKAFGKRIKDLRKKYKFSQSELSALANIDKGSLQRIERGYNPTLNTLRRLANAFEISLSAEAMTTSLSFKFTTLSFKINKVTILDAFGIYIKYSIGLLVLYIEQDYRLHPQIDGCHKLVT